jgi:hypothetical protein
MRDVAGGEAGKLILDYGCWMVDCSGAALAGSELLVASEEMLDDEFWILDGLQKCGMRRTEGKSFQFSGVQFSAASEKP